MTKKIAFFGIMAGVLSAISGALPAALPAQASCTIYITASNWKFTPDKIAVAAGQPVTLRLTSASGVHGIQSDALGIKQTIISPGKSIDVTFTPKRTGSYRVPCAVFCGPGHANMALTIEVR